MNNLKNSLVKMKKFSFSLKLNETDYSVTAYLTL